MSGLEIKEIEIFTTDMLLDELEKRFDRMVFVGERENIKDKRFLVDSKRSKGDYVECLGLCAYLSDWIMNKLGIERQEVEGDG